MCTLFTEEEFFHKLSYLISWVEERVSVMFLHTSGYVRWFKCFQLKKMSALNVRPLNAKTLGSLCFFICAYMEKVYTNSKYSNNSRTITCEALLPFYFVFFEEFSGL